MIYDLYNILKTILTTNKYLKFKELLLTQWTFHFKYHLNLNNFKNIIFHPTIDKFVNNEQRNNLKDYNINFRYFEFLGHVHGGIDYNDNDEEEEDNDIMNDNINDINDIRYYIF